MGIAIFVGEDHVVNDGYAGAIEVREDIKDRLNL
jgi:hypothetical protein